MKHMRQSGLPSPNRAWFAGSWRCERMHPPRPQKIFEGIQRLQRPLKKTRFFYISGYLKSGNYDKLW